MKGSVNYVLLVCICMLPVYNVAAIVASPIVTSKIILPPHLQKKQGKVATVFIFFSPECPLCQSYTPTINKLIDSYSDKGVAFVGVVSSSQFTVAQINQYTQIYHAKLTFVLDNSLAIANIFGATITPEVFLLNKKQQVIYSGRIDNWAYEVSKKRTLITVHNLNDAIVATLAQKPILVPKTKAVGCFIE